MHRPDDMGWGSTPRVCAPHTCGRAHKNAGIRIAASCPRSPGLDHVALRVRADRDDRRVIREQQSPSIRLDLDDGGERRHEDAPPEEPGGDHQLALPNLLDDA
jgi:hypothetical protein